MSVSEKLTALADAIRKKAGTGVPMNLDEMADAVASINGGKAVSSLICETKASSGNLYGDANGDGLINKNDVLAISKYIVHSGTVDIPASDMNGDGIVDNTDMLSLSKIVNTMSEGQILGKVTVNYSDNSTGVFFVPIDVPDRTGA